MSAFITCGYGNHAFNNAIQAVNHKLNPDIIKDWDKKCDCGEKKYSEKDYEEFMNQFDF